MNVPSKLGLFAGALAVVFVAAYTVAAAVAPDRSGAAGSDSPAHAGHQSAPASSAAAAPGVRGVTVGSGGYLLSGLAAPAQAGQAGVLTFSITDSAGSAVTDYTVEHDKQLHLIVVRSDGTAFRHVHPTVDAAGRWSIPWQWQTAGTYRVYADFVPAATGETLTLTRTLEVGGDYQPRPPAGESRRSEVAGFQVEVTGELRAGADSELTVTVSRNGQPVTTLQPYLGAFGHLVALRDGDLAYLHVHPEGSTPTPGQLSGPQVRFATNAPTPGRYLLYLDFQVDGQVHTATFVVDTAAERVRASATSSSSPASSASVPPEHAGH